MGSGHTDAGSAPQGLLGLPSSLVANARDSKFPTGTASRTLTPAGLSYSCAGWGGGWAAGGISSRPTWAVAAHSAVLTTHGGDGAVPTALEEATVPQ